MHANLRGEQTHRIVLVMLILLVLCDVSYLGPRALIIFLQSFEVITEKAHVQCSFCNAIFSSKVYTAGDSCYCCFTGPLQQKD